MRLVDVVQGDALPHARLGASQWRWIAMVRDPTSFVDKTACRLKIGAMRAWQPVRVSDSKA
jgi:hypothetical protein